MKTKSKKTRASKREIMRVVAFRLEDQIKVAKKYEFRNWGQSAGIRRLKRIQYNSFSKVSYTFFHA